MHRNKNLIRFASAALAFSLQIGLSGGVALANPFRQGSDYVRPALYHPAIGIETNRTIVSQMADMTAPVIDRSTLSVVQTATTPGGLVTIRVKVTDENTGVREVKFTFDNVNGGYRYLTTIRPDASGYYSVQIPIDSNTHDGGWSLSFLEAVDNNGNCRFYNGREVDLSRGNFTVVNPKADMMAPVVQVGTLKINQTTAKPGDTIRMGALAADEKTSVKEVQYTLINENRGSKVLSSTKADINGYYMASFVIDANTYHGKWTLQDISVVDDNGNYRAYSSYDKDLSKGNFTVDNPGADMTPPTIDISTLSVNRTTAYPGQSVRVKVKASDSQTGVRSVEFDLHNEYGGMATFKDTTPDSYGYYSMDLDITDVTHTGKWYVNGIGAVDNNDNYTGNWFYDTDLSKGSFTVQESLLPENPINAIVIDKDTTWNYKVVDQDVYVAPDAVLKTGDVNIRGNLYIYGTVETSQSLKATNLYAVSVRQGAMTSRTKGALYVAGGTTSFLKSNLSAQPVPSIPIQIMSENQVNPDGILPLIEGATVKVGTLTLNGQSVPLNYNGTFTVDNVQVGKAQSLNFRFVDSYGKETLMTYAVDNPIDKVEVLAGASRYETANIISAAAFPSAGTAILVSGANFPDALAAGPLATALNAPILLTSKTELTAVTKQELVRLGVKKVIIMGGTTAIDAAVETSLKAMSGMTVERIAGTTRYDTAIKAAERLELIKGKPTSVILASGSSFPDALAIGSYAAKNGIPILLTDGKSLGLGNDAYLKSKGITKVTMVGGTLVLSSTLQQSLVTKGLTVTRLAGATRTETATLVAKTYYPEATGAIVANGWTFADALAAVPYAAKLNVPILLVSKTAIDTSVKGYLANSPVHDIKVVGGELVISSAVQTQLMEAMAQ